jgi:two-component system CheB/CheR fusion protein
VNTICDAVNSQARIIDDLLDVARVRTGKLKLKRLAVDLSRVLQDVHTVVLNDNHRARVTLQLPDAAPLVIDADPTRLEQIIWNLVSNALKFTPANGQVQLIASRDGKMARLDVKDSGIGLDEQSLHEVFDLFGQAANQHANHQREGLGIGLSLVRQLAEAHGGSVNVSSDGLGFGCTFTLLMPLSHPEVEILALVPGDRQTGRLAGVTVLLIDDSPEVLETLKLLLEMEDAQVIAFDQPVEALKAARSGRYDVVISDVGMPVMNGHELMLALRELPHVQNIPAIALTGYGAQSDIENARKSGFDRHIGKPVSYDDLIETIEELRRT